jgi:hypothetical protein
MLEILILVAVVILGALLKKDNRYSEMERRQAMQRSLRRLQARHRQSSL